MKKIYILDTNVLMYDPNALFMFEDNTVIIPLVVLDELDKHKTGVSQSSLHARVTIRNLDELRAIGNLSKGVKNEHGGIIKVETNYSAKHVDDLDINRADNRIINMAVGLVKGHPKTKVTVVTKDINLRVKCDALGVRAENYISDLAVKNISELYTGVAQLDVEPGVIDTLYSSGAVESCQDYMPNQYVVLKSVCSQQSALTRYVKGNLVPIKKSVKIKGIKPRNAEQRFLFDALLDPNISLVTITGRAGTGKTLCAVAAGITQVLDGAYNKMIISRAMAPLGRDIGFLPGSLSEKLSPWLAPLYDNLEVVLADDGPFFIDSLVNEGKIEIGALTYIRGRSLPRSFMVVDELQNITKKEIKAIITRMGEGSKLVLLGDVEQIDMTNIDAISNGLTCAVEAFKDDEISAHITLKKGERSELATKAAEKL